MNFNDFIAAQKCDAEDKAERNWGDRETPTGWVMNYTGTEHFVEGYPYHYRWTGRSLKAPLLTAYKHAKTVCGEQMQYHKQREFRKRCSRCEFAVSSAPRQQEET